jgi:hypothetical protein
MCGSFSSACLPHIKVLRNLVLRNLRACVRPSAHGCINISAIKNWCDRGARDARGGFNDLRVLLISYLGIGKDIKQNIEELGKHIDYVYFFRKDYERSYDPSRGT